MPSWTLDSHVDNTRMLKHFVDTVSLYTEKKTGVAVGVVRLFGKRSFLTSLATPLKKVCKQVRVKTFLLNERAEYMTIKCMETRCLLCTAFALTVTELTNPT